MAAEQTEPAKHEWITFKRVYGYDEDHATPKEIDARWCANCGTLDFGDTNETYDPVRFFTTRGVRQSEPPCTR